MDVRELITGARIDADDLVQVVHRGHHTLRGVSVSIAPAEFFTSTVLECDDTILRMFAALGQQLGEFVGRTRTQEQIERFFTMSQDLLCSIRRLCAGEPSAAADDLDYAGDEQQRYGGLAHGGSVDRPG